MKAPLRAIFCSRISEWHYYIDKDKVGIPDIPLPE
jgi:hypothetical protein